MSSLDPADFGTPVSARVSVSRYRTRPTSLALRPPELPRTNANQVARIVRRDPETSTSFNFDLAQIIARITDIQSSRSLHLALKRAFDIALASIGLVVLSPLLLIVALAVRLSSPGPIIFKQLRHGEEGKPFEIYKFRTLREEAADPSGTTQTARGDPRVTPVGRILRRRNLDELPQLWNVIKGDMSLVGPRPHPLCMLADGKPYESLVAAYPLRHAMRPGVTGLAQAKGFRGETRDPVSARMRIVCDLYYVSNFSFLLDLKILALTTIREFRGGTGV